MEGASPKTRAPAIIYRARASAFGRVSRAASLARRAPFADNFDPRQLKLILERFQGLRRRKARRSLAPPSRPDPDYKAPA